MATFGVYEKAFDFLVDKGFEVYPPGTKKGECKNNYLVLRSETTSQIQNFSSEYHYYSLLCYSKTYTNLLQFSDSVKQNMAGLAPMLMPTGVSTPPYWDEEINAFMVSIEYVAKVRNKLVKTPRGIIGR